MKKGRKDAEKHRVRRGAGGAICVIMALATLLLGFPMASQAEEAPTPAPAEDGFDITAAHVGVMTGSTGEEYAKASYPNAKIDSYSNIMDAVASMQAGKLDAVITSDVSANNIARTNPGLMVDGGRLTDEAVSVVTMPQDSDLMAKVNEVLAELESDGTLPDMRQRWMEEYPPVEVEIEPVVGPVLHIGLTATRPPFSSVLSDGRIVGLAPELAYRIGAKLGYRIEFVVTEFSALLPALQSGKTDAIIDLLVYTPERAKFVLFSEAYYDSGQVILRPVANAVSESFWETVQKSFYYNILAENRWMMLLNGLAVTLIISLLSFALATLIGLVVCFFSLSKRKLLNILARVYLTILRGIPIVVLLLIVFYIIFAKVGIDPIFVAVVAFGLASGAQIGVIFHTAVGTVDAGQIEAARSMGFSKFGALRIVTLPQAAQVALPVYKTAFIALLKETAIVGFIAIVDLTKAGEMIRASTFDAFFPLIVIALLYSVMIIALSWLFDRIVAATDKRKRGQAAL